MRGDGGQIESGHGEQIRPGSMYQTRPQVEVEPDEPQPVGDPNPSVHRHQDVQFHVVDPQVDDPIAPTLARSVPGPRYEGAGVSRDQTAGKGSGTKAPAAIRRLEDHNKRGLRENPEVGSRLRSSRRLHVPDS